MKTRFLPSLYSIAVGCTLVATASSVEGQQSRNNLFDGEWTLTFDVNTPPGGVTLNDMYGSNSPYNMHFHASKQSLQVNADGTFAWRDFSRGALTINGTANYFGTRTNHWAKHQPLLKADGKATAMRTPPGSPQAYDRSLPINLDYSGGSGTYADNHGGGGAYIVDAAGQQMTVTGGVTVSTLPVTYWQAKWSLKPARIVREEIGPDETRETITYEDSRPAEVTTKIGKYKVTERIEVKQVRRLGLVPRG